MSRNLMIKQDAIVGLETTQKHYSLLVSSEKNFFVSQDLANRYVNTDQTPNTTILYKIIIIFL